MLPSSLGIPYYLNYCPRIRQLEWDYQHVPSRAQYVIRLSLSPDRYQSRAILHLTNGETEAGEGRWGVTGEADAFSPLHRLSMEYRLGN